MHDDLLSRRTIKFVNAAHALDHFVLLIYPTAVIAIAAQWRTDYGALIALATGAFVAFGACSLPMGWLAERYGRRNLLAVFFFGYGLSCLGLSTSGTPRELAGWLLVLGVFSSIYHPIGSAMLVSHARHLGRDLGWNGVWGNLGAALASGVTAALAAWFGWQAAFVVPGVVCLGIGAAFVALVPGDGVGQVKASSAAGVVRVPYPGVFLVVFALAIICGGMTFNVLTIALPKVIDERLGMPLALGATGWLATGVFVFGALMQLAIGRLVDRVPLPRIFAGLSILQPVGLALAATSNGVALLAGLVLAMAAIYGQVVVNDAMVARYVAPHLRAKAYSIRYFLGFTVSGFAAPFIAVLHGGGGFGRVLAVTAGLGGIVFACAVAAMIVMRSPDRALAGQG